MIKPTTMLELASTLKEHTSLDYTPAGIWALDSNNDKIPLDPNRKDRLDWENYPDDNMAKIFLKREYLVIDIDGDFSHADDTYIHLTTGIKLPLTFYTNTSKPTKIHAYYTTPLIGELPGRTKSVVADKIDTFTYGVLFEGHTLKNCRIHPHPIAQLKEHKFLEDLLAMTPTLGSHPGDLYPITNPKIQKATERLRNHSEMKLREKNDLLRIVMPKLYIPKNANPSKVGVSYNLINDMATKLSCCAELSSEDVESFLRFYIKDMNGLDPDFGNVLKSNILATLPYRDAVLAYDPELEEDLQTILDKQPLTTRPVFRTALTTKSNRPAFIQIDKHTLEPVEFQDVYLHEKGMMPALAPERIIRDDMGVPRGWDDNVPTVRTVDCPYSPPIEWYKDFYRVNLYIRTEYQKNTMPKALMKLNSNLLGRLIISVVPQEHVDYVLRYLAYIIFSDKPPKISMMIASESTASGKSILTLELLDQLIGGAASIKGSELKDGWGDYIVGKRLLSIEDMSKTDWSTAYPFLKAQSGNATKTVNMKSAAVVHRKVKLAITGTSNYPISVDQKDRRLFCLEPAHADPDLPNLPLSPMDASSLTRLMATEDYDSELQDIMDHLNYIFQQPLTAQQEKELYEEAPNTKYKDEWKLAGKGYVRRLVELIPYPEQLHALMRIDRTVNTKALVNLYKYILYTYNPDTEKIALPWEWFANIVPYVSRDHDNTISKQSLGDALGVTWKTNINKGLYHLPEKHDLPPEYEEWKNSGLNAKLSLEAIQQYSEICKELLRPSIDTTPADLQVS